MSVRKSANTVNYTPGGLIQKKSVLKLLIEELNLICMPSSLWGVHQDSNDSKQKLLPFSVLKISEDSLKTSKSVVLSETEDNILKIDVFMNNTLVEIPYILKSVSNVDDLNNLLLAIDAVKFCKYYLLSNKENICLIFNLPFMDVCSRCLNSSNVSNSKKDLSETEDNKLRDITFSNSQKKGTNKVDNIQCIICNKIFTVEENLTKHYKDHLLKNDDGNFECTVCLNSFDDVMPILEHYREYHICVKFIKCAVCIKKFTTVQQLRKHIRNHSEYAALTCGRCNKDFISKQKLKTHSCIKSARTLHTSKVHLCSVCSTRYATNYLLQQHQKEHQIKTHASLKCKECKKNFDNEDQAVDHKKYCKHRQLKYACTMCHKKFSCVSQRLCHVKKVHPLHM